MTMQTHHLPDAQATLPSGLRLEGVSRARKTKNSAATVLVTAAVVIAAMPLVWLLFTLVANGLRPVISADWWTSSQKGVLYSSAGGGALHAMIGTLVQTAVSAVISIPLGILTAIYLVEYGRNGVVARLTTFMVDILTGVPSIVAALFVYSAWIVLFGFSRSGIAVSLALVILMVPVIVRNTEEMLRVVPQDLREASLALGVPKWRTILSVVVPTAASGMVTGVLLAIARVMGESAPVLILVGSTQIINWDVLHGPQSSLPLMMLDMYKAGVVPAVLDKLWGAAFTLVLLIAGLNVLARIIAARWAIKT